MVQGPIAELSILNRDPTFLEGPRLLHDLVRESSSIGAPAIDFLENGSRRTITYKSLHASSNALASRMLRALSRLENASAIVPIFLPQCPELYIAVLAVLKAGKAFCPVGLDVPEDRLNFILDDISADLLITHSENAPDISSRNGMHVFLVDHELSQSNDFVEAVRPDIDTNDLAYVLYTSGSTGLPKAVCVSHRAATQSLLAHHRHIPEFERFLQFAAPTFDVSIFEIFFPLLRGCTLVGCTRSRMINDLPAIIRDMDVDAAELTPTVVSNLLQGRESVPRLKMLLTIGEMLTRHVITEFAGNDSQQSILWGMYGPTEAAIHCTLQPRFQAQSAVGNIGFPLDTVSVFVVEPVGDESPLDRIRLLPLGESGELAVGGPQIAEGYLNRPELTAAAFIRDPELGHLYRTGDKVRLHPDGTLECLGRIVSGQVKLRGQRVELGEVEQVISKVDGCHTVAVLVLEDTLVAFCATGSRRVSKTSVLDTCERWLPRYMIPTDVVFLPSVPQLPSGKIDKTKLRTQYCEERQDSYSSTTRVSATTHPNVLHVLQQVLQRGISPTTRLDHAGLDSLRAIRLASLLRQEGYHLGAVDVLSAINSDELMVLCEKNRVDEVVGCDDEFDIIKKSALKLPELSRLPDEIEDIVACTPLQEAMIAETVARADAYCNWIEVELSQWYTFENIRTCLQQLALGNDILRSGFAVSATKGCSSFAQVVWKELARSQILEVTAFARKYSLGSSLSLLRPLTIQVNTKLERPRILFQIYHALYDGWSFDLFLRDLSSILCGNALMHRPPYRKVIEYYTQLRRKGDHSSDSMYWSSVLEGFATTTFPNFNGKLKPYSGLQSISGRSSVSTRSLFDYAQELTVNPQVIFQAAVAYLTSKYVDSADVTVGTVTSGRTIPVMGIEDILGPCIASLPLRLDFSKHSTVKDILKHIQALNRAMLEHCTLPLRDISKMANLPPGTHLFDVLFVWQQTLISSGTGEDEDVTMKVLDSADNLEFKLTLEFEPGKDCIEYRATYDPSIFPAAQIMHMMQQIDELVSFFLHNSNGNADDILQCFSPPSLSIANFPPVQTPIQHGPAYAVERWATEIPDNLALIFGAVEEGLMTTRHTMTYKALNQRANRLAHALLKFGAGEDRPICIVMEKSLDLYVSILAVLKTGSGYIPIVPDSPPERIRKILIDARLPLCIAEGSIAEQLSSEHLCTIINLDNLDFLKYSERNLDIDYDGSRLAYAVFTSGSTGIPKGVLVTQNNLMSNLEYLFNLYPTSKTSRLLQSCSQAFDVSVFEIFFTWYAGMCLCSATKDDLYRDLEAAINHLEVTHLSLTPTVAALVNPINVPSVRFLVTAGEALTEYVRRQWAQKGLYQGYGPSETTNICTVKVSVSTEDLINNIGQPFHNTSAFVLDPDSERALPRGAVGELCFGGFQVFRGYSNMPELNATKLVDHPLYGRIYRSGDLGRQLPDNSILFMGRLDDQVKVRGQRVELGEITSKVLDSDHVEDAVTILCRYDASYSRLVTFWVPVGASADEFTVLQPDHFGSATSHIFELLGLALPTYMIPTHLVPITRIPFTSQTKVDKNALSLAYKDLPKETVELFGPSVSTNDDPGSLSEQETIIAEALALTLDISASDISRKSSFFSYGLDSVSAIRFSVNLARSGFADVPISVILRNATVARLCSRCEWKATPDPVTRSDKIAAVNLLPASLMSQISSDYQERGIQVQKIMPCTPLQEAMLSGLGTPEESSYCNTMIFNVVGAVSRLLQCWTQMFKRHDILRTAFVPIDDPRFAFAQVVLAYEELGWEELDRSTNIQNYVQSTIPALLNSAKPPVRIGFIRNQDSVKLIFCCHHALYDATAIAILLEEVEKVYSNVELESTVPYERFIDYMVNQNFEEADQFWKSALKDFEPIYFPDLIGQIRCTTSDTSTFKQTLQISLSEVLRACQDSNVSLLPTIQAAWAKLLHFYLGEDDLCFGNVVSGRLLPGEALDRLVAPCFNTLPVRLKFDFGETNAHLVRKLHDINIELLPFQLTPLRRIQVQAKRSTSRLFDTLVILQQPNTPLNESIWSLEQDNGITDVPIVCEVTQDRTNDTLAMTLHYRTTLMSDCEAKRVGDSFEYALKSLIYFPRSFARDTIGFPPDLLAESNLDFRHLDSSTSCELLHSAFEYNACLRPLSIALDFQHPDGNKTTWTYGTLDESANRIANALIERNVKPEDIVPVHMPKCPAFYASILGILKAGAAFTPIHTDLPDARKQFMLSETLPKVVLCIDKAPQEWCGDIAILDVNTLETYSREKPSVQGLSSTTLAYCLYTSGSTGLPKAVAMAHGSPIQTIESSRTLVPWKHESKLLQYAAISFDMCYFDCFLAWSFGFTLCAAQQDTMLNNLAYTINSLEVSLLDLTPSVALSLSRADVPTVEWLYCIGEPLSPQVIKEWQGACANSYGPTEAAFCTTIFPTQTSIKSSIIGKPFPTTSFAIFPKEGDRTLPLFGVGELYIGGAQLARGYYGNNELTEMKFVQRNGQRFYKSGDIVRMLADGNFEFIGRADDQVKIRGLRVELGEISHIIQRCDTSFASVTVQIIKRDDNAKDQLVSFLVIDETFNHESRSYLKQKAKRTATEKLPSYMVPQFFIFIDKIPRSTAGKIDKNALTAIFRASEDISDNSNENEEEHEWTRAEDLVRQSFAKLSNSSVDDISSTTTLYQLGLDSISAVQIAAALRKQGFTINAADVLKYMTCAGIAAHMERPNNPFLKADPFDFESFDTKFRKSVIERCEIENQDVEAIRPCTPLQQGIIAQFVSKKGMVYYNYLQLKLDRSVDLTKLKRAWSVAMKTHRMLRTGFAHIDDNKYSFSMLHYTPDAAVLPWTDQSNNTEHVTIKDWLLQSAQAASQHLQQPPWQILITSEGGYIYLNLAILHALFDAQSLRMIFDDIAAEYRDEPSASLTPLEPTMSEILQPIGIQESHQFWKSLGQGVVPTRFPNLAPLQYDPTGPVVLTRTCTELLSALERGCRKSNITLQAASIASWMTLLSAYTGESTVTCGVVLSGRTFDAAESVAFPCITTVPYVCKIDKDTEKLVREIMTLNAEIQRHQSTPLSEIQRLMKFPTESLFDTIFSFQKTSTNRYEDDPWTITDEKATVEYPISLELEPKEERLDFRLTFQPHVVPREHAAIILNQLDLLLAQFVFLGNHPIATEDPVLYSITPAKRPTLPSQHDLLHEFVEASALNYPERIALEFATSIHGEQYESEVWTYAELDAEGNRIAHLLISNGARPGELVGVCFDKCPEACFAMLGILKAGCAFVALDPGAPGTRKEFIIRDSNARIVLSMRAQSTNLPGSPDSLVFNLDEVDVRSLSSRKPMLERRIDSQDRCYCLYTSGTTGTPKGCEISHENAVQAILSFQKLFSGHWEDNSRWLQFASFHFDVSVLEQYWSWSVGIRVISASRDLIFEDLANAIRVLGVTHIDLTPSLARTLHPNDVPSLCKGVFITGGESLRQEILDVWGPKEVIYNGYGPTEATIGVTMYPRVPANGKPSNIGAQFDNVGSYVLEPGHDTPVLRGAIGELCVSGKLVGKGYLNRSELTEERFPYLSRFNERVYRTGDLVRILHDETFEFIGRVDDQIKLRGQRLEIGEINTVIKQSSTRISDVATLVIKHSKQQKEQLVSFIVTSSHGEPRIILEHSDDLDSAKTACKAKLPGYMIPTHFIHLSAMPLSTNNKVDRNRLKETYNALTVNDLHTLSHASDGTEEEWSNVEVQVRDILAKMLEIDAHAIRRSSSFFEAGLDSISVIRFSRALKEVGFKTATASLVMSNTSIKHLARHLSDKTPARNDRGIIAAAQQSITAIQHRHRRGVAEMLCVDPRQIEALAPCTPLQQGMIARSFGSKHAAYFNTFRFQLTKDVDMDRLQSAWEEIFASSQILRTVFCNTDDGFVQAVLQHVWLNWNSHILSADEDVTSTLEQIALKWQRHNQSVLKRPFEIHLLTTPSRKLLVVHIFHALYDGISIQLVLKAVWDIYNGKWHQDIGPPFQSVLAHGPLKSSSNARDFWKSQLSNVSPSHLPHLTGNSATSTTSINREVPNLVAYEAVRRRLNVTHQSIAQACWATVLQNYIGGMPTIGVIVSGRQIDFGGADRVIGPLFNTIPYPHRSHAGDTWSSIIKRTHNFNVAAMPYQHTPLRDIMRWCERAPGIPLFDTLFVYQIADENEEWAKNNIWQLEEGIADADYPMAIEIEQKENGRLKVTLVTQNHVANDEVSNRLFDEFVHALRSVLDNPEADAETVYGHSNENPKASNILEHESPTYAVKDSKMFEWTNDAIAIRNEIAQLSGSDLNEISEHTSVFELGLDSIDAIKLSSKLKKSGIELPVSGVLRGPTIAKMLDHISSGKKPWMKGPSDMIFNSHKKRLESYVVRHVTEPDEIVRVLPLTPLQEGMVAEMITSGYTRYYNHDVLKLTADVDLNKLCKAWSSVVESSPILRTSFIQIDDPSVDFAYAQVVHRSSHDVIRHKKVDEIPDFGSIIESIRKEVASASDPGPLFHIHLVESPDQRYIILSIAHALYDGWSLGLLHSDVNQAYHNRFKPRPSYEFALREILANSGLDAITFWRDYLSDSVQNVLPHRHAKKQVVEAVCRKERKSGLKLTDIISFTKRNNITLQTLGQTVYALVLASYVRSLDVTFGSVLSGRNNDKIAEVLFPTMNTVAIRTILHGSRQEFLHYVQENFVQIMQYQHFPLRKAQLLAGAQGKLFDTLFIFQKRMDDSTKAAPKLYESVQGQSDVEYPVCVEMEVQNSRLFWRCAVTEEIFDDAGAQDLLDKLDMVLGNILESPLAPTVDFTSEGISVCGLPSFKDQLFEQPDDGPSDMRTSNSGQGQSTTAKAIREVLSFVSKTPEEEIDAGMTIFHIGLDSISAIKVSSLLRRQSILLSVGEMLKAGTIEKMAQVVDQRPEIVVEDETDAQAVIKGTISHLNLSHTFDRAGIKAADVEQTLPATAGQVYMLSMWLKNAGTRFYPEFVYQLTGAVTFKKLQEAWGGLVAANPIFRTRMNTTHDESVPFIQIVLRNEEKSVTNISQLDERDASKTIQESSVDQPYAHLFASKCSSGWNLRLKIHHALYDGVSLPLLMRQLQDICNGGQPRQHPDTFGEFVATSSTSTALESRKAFWTHYLQGLEQHRLPQPHNAPTSRVELFKPRALTSVKSLNRLVRKHGLTTQSLFLAVYAKLYANLISMPKRADIVLGIYLANRSFHIPHIARSGIPTLNLLPIRVATPSEVDVFDLAAQIQYDVQNISNPVNSAVSLAEVERWTGIKLDTFVNFLKIPAMDESSTSPGDGVCIEPVQQWNEEVRKVTTHPCGSFRAPQELQNEATIGSYLVRKYTVMFAQAIRRLTQAQHAIDIEATVRDGALDIGIFALEELMDLETGEKLREKIIEDLEILSMTET